MKHFNFHTTYPEIITHYSHEHVKEYLVKRPNQIQSTPLIVFKNNPGCMNLVWGGYNFRYNLKLPKSQQLYKKSHKLSFCAKKVRNRLRILRNLMKKVYIYLNSQFCENRSDLQ